MAISEKDKALAKIVVKKHLKKEVKNLHKINYEHSTRKPTTSVVG
jgi:hypothetical protein